MESLIACLKKRGLVEGVTHELLEEHLKTPRLVYCGFDPTADSLHLGNLVGIVMLKWFQKFGHKPVVILGGATARIGDPSGKSCERSLLSEDEIDINIIGIRKHFEKILDFTDVKTAPLILNNNSWLSKFNVIEFMRDVGKHFRMSSMLAKESVKTRIDSESGMSFTEFSYQVMQGYDFYHLNQEHDVSVQIGGSDQWGNITAGTDITRRLNPGEGRVVCGLTFPLLTSSDGKKFGKSEEGAIWLAAERLSIYQFYQHLIRVSDADVVKLLRMLTMMELDEITRIENSMKEEGYVPNSAQKTLAQNLTAIVHGKNAVRIAESVTQALKPGSDTELDPEIFEALGDAVPKVKLHARDLSGARLTSLIADNKLMASRGEASRLIKDGGVYLNNKRIEKNDHEVTEKDLIGSRYLLVSIGKKKKFIIETVSD